tara:strand:- start:1411 stop:1653 length:243 start_codon:yes stop_codon:yes gene_type:complete
MTIKKTLYCLRFPYGHSHSLSRQTPVIRVDSNAKAVASSLLIGASRCKIHSDSICRMFLLLVCHVLALLVGVVKDHNLVL